MYIILKKKFKYKNKKNNFMKKNLIIICIDGGRLDYAQKSKIFRSLLPGTNFFSQSITYAPYTNSSIHAILSGTYGNRNGCYSYWHSSRFKHNNFLTLTEYLHNNNYYTYADVHSDLVLPKIGFDDYVLYDEDEVELNSRHSNLIKNIKNKSQMNPFFLYLHYESIHTTIKNEVLRKYTNFSQEYFDNKEKNIERYTKLFTNAEKYLETIFETLIQEKILETTDILVISDHGISIGEKYGERAYGAFCYDYTIRTFALYITSNFESKEIIQQVRHVDFMPTILDKFGIKLDKNFEKLDGISLMPLLNNETMNELISYTETANPLEESAPPKKPNTKCVRTSKWKLIFNEYDNSKELYNLENDPCEENNLIGNNLEIEKKLFEELEKNNFIP